MLDASAGGSYHEPEADEWDAELIREAARMVGQNIDILTVVWATAHPEIHRYPWQSAAAWQWLADHGDADALRATITARVGQFATT